MASYSRTLVSSVEGSFFPLQLKSHVLIFTHLLHVTSDHSSESSLIFLLNRKNNDDAIMIHRCWWQEFLFHE